MTPQNKLYEAAKKLADSLYEWLSQQRYGNESFMHVSVCCDFVGMQRFKKALQQQIISAFEQEQPEAIAGEDITTLVDESFKGLAELINDANPNTTQQKDRMGA